MKITNHKKSGKDRHEIGFNRDFIWKYEKNLKELSSFTDNLYKNILFSL